MNHARHLKGHGWRNVSRARTTSHSIRGFSGEKGDGLASRKQSGKTSERTAALTVYLTKVHRKGTQETVTSSFSVVDVALQSFTIAPNFQTSKYELSRSLFDKLARFFFKHISLCSPPKAPRLTKGSHFS